MASTAERSSLIHRALPLITLSLFTLALWVLHDALRQYNYHHILAQLRVIPSSQIFSALGLTALSYLVMTVYDQLGICYVQHPLHKGKATVAAFISYAFSNSIGLFLLTAGSIRYRLYSAWGLSTEEIARLVSFTTLTFWLGLATVGGIVLIVAPLDMPAIGGLTGIYPIRLIGLGLLALTTGYLLIVLIRRRPFRFWNWDIPLPSMRLAGSQLLVGSLDWTLAGYVLFTLLPEQSSFSFFQFLSIYLLAQMVALISNVPGGLGVFESMILILAPEIPADALLSSMLIYRGIYYLLPLSLATILLGANELLEKKPLVKKAMRHADRWWGIMVPPLLAATTLVGGALLLFSGATPAVPGRLHWLDTIIPLPLIELSHFLGSLAGCCLLLLARGILGRLDAAYVLTAILLGLGSLFSLLKGVDYEESLLLGLILAALLPCRKHFYRRASLFSEPFSPGWIVTVLLVLLSSFWLGFFSFKHVDFSSQLWWQFTLKDDAPRFLRAMVGSTALLLILAMARLLRPAAKDPGQPGPDELDQAQLIIRQAPVTLPYVALLGDKALLFDDQQKGFVMYGVEGRSWVALGDPVGPREVARSLAWNFRELVQRHGGQTVFYEVGTDMLHVYLDMGMTLFKLGEAASVELPKFSLEGKKRSDLRYSHRRLDKEECSFEVIPVSHVPELMPELQKISNAWLKEKNTREKGFSLGRFDERYLMHFPVAVVKQRGRIIAFANLWMSEDKNELSLDLMRFLPEAPRGVMDYLFISLMLWGKNQGFQHFDLGMAPLSGLENRPFAPLWNRIGAVIFQQGEHFYNFEGLRGYKQKFDPVWEPRYIACPGGFTLPRILLNVAALISGGIKGIVTK